MPKFKYEAHRSEMGWTGRHSDGLNTTSLSQQSTVAYKDLTRKKRYRIHSLKRRDISLGCIAAKLQRNWSTTCWERIGVEQRPRVVDQRSR